MTGQHIRDALKAFNTEHQAEFRAVAITLQRSGIRRIHFGLDFVNDDGAPSDYAVYEYDDGHIVEQAQWPDELDYDLFGFGIGYCEPYTFDIESATIGHDAEGGHLDIPADYALIRSYHSAARLELLEEEAGEEGEQWMQLASFNEDHDERLSELAGLLAEQGIHLVYFGIDAVGEGEAVSYPLSDWCFAYRNDDTEDIIGGDVMEPQLAAMKAFTDLWDALPQFGAFSFGVEHAQVSVDEYSGGSLELRPGLTRAYHGPEQLQALLAQVEAD